MTGNALRGLRGWALIKVTGAATEDFLNLLSDAEIPFRRLEVLDDVTIRLLIPANNISDGRRFGKKTVCTVQVLRVSGMVPFFRAMGIRLLYPLVLAGMAAFVFWLQGHIWFLTVSGNETVPREMILRTLEEEGVTFWTAEKELDLNLVKNRVLARLPELSWITVNTGGGRAEVVVRERQEKPVLQRDAAPANLVAKRGGLILSVDAVRGSPQVQPGALVEEGELLISGVTSLDRILLLTRAEGEVYARTWREIRAALPNIAGEKRFTGRSKARYSVTLGKKTINFFKNSGISYDVYDKIRETRNLTLPGGKAFPVSVTKTVYREYTLLPGEELPETEEADVSGRVLAQIAGELTAGTILKTRLTPEYRPDGLLLLGTAECREEIGRISEIKE